MNTRAEAGREGLVEAALWVFLTLGVCSILYLGREVLVPLALATLFSFALSPVVQALQKFGLPRALGAVIALALLVTALGVWLWFVSGQVSDLAKQLPSYSHNIEEKAHGLAEKFGGGRGAGLVSSWENMFHEMEPVAPLADPPQRVVVIDNSPVSRLSTIGAYLSPVLSPLAQFLVVLVFTAFLLAQQEDLRNRLIKLIGPKDLYRTTEGIDDAGSRIGRMLFSQVLLNGTFGFIIAVALWLIGVPNPALFGAIAGIARFVPYIGVFFGLAPPLLVAFAFDPGWTVFLMTLGLFVVAEFDHGAVDRAHPLRPQFRPIADGGGGRRGGVVVPLGADRPRSGDAADHMSCRAWPPRPGSRLPGNAARGRAAADRGGDLLSAHAGGRSARGGASGASLSQARRGRRILRRRRAGGAAARPRRRRARRSRRWPARKDDAIDGATGAHARLRPSGRMARDADALGAAGAPRAQGWRKRSWRRCCATSAASPCCMAITRSTRSPPRC